LKVILKVGRIEGARCEREGPLIVCSCHAVTDREIRRLAREGATSPRQVARACGAGSACGGCRPTVRAILAEATPAPAECEAGLPLGAAPAAT
jgi:bacterioferritin-associated ferredoxin